MLATRYRRDYDGEFILVETVLAENAIRQRREWISNPITNNHISGRAAVIVSEFANGKFTHRRLQRHRGGLLATKRLQTYGIGDLWRDMRFDFFLATQQDQVAEIVAQKYHEKSVVYSTNRRCIENPGCFYPVPYQPVMDVLAQILYLSAFDEHQEIFMFGYRGIVGGTTNWISDVNQVIQAYPGTRFWAVDHETVPPLWLENPNFDLMPFRKFVTYCDV